MPFSHGAVRKWLTACWCSASAGSQIGACTDDSGAFLLPCAVWNGSCLSSPSPICCLSQFVIRAAVAPVYRWDILSSRRNLYKSICCKIVPVFCYFCAENEHRLSCSNCSRIYWKTPFGFSVAPLGANWMVLWIYLHVIGTLPWCYLTYALTWKNSCWNIGLLLCLYLKGICSLIQHWKGLINCHWSESNWICSIRKKQWMSLKKFI